MNVTLRDLAFMLTCFMGLFLMDEIVLILKSDYTLCFLFLVSYICIFFFLLKEDISTKSEAVSVKMGLNPPEYSIYIISKTFLLWCCVSNQKNIWI